MVDRRRADAVDEAAARFADTLAESYRIVYEQAAEAQERQGRLAKDFFERVLDHLKEQTESGRAWVCRVRAYHGGFENLLIRQTLTESFVESSNLVVVYVVEEVGVGVHRLHDAGMP